MIEPEHVTSDLPELDRAEDPSGGAVAWALLAMSATLVFGGISAAVWAW